MANSRKLHSVTKELLVKTTAGDKKKIKYLKRHINFLYSIISRQQFLLENINKDTSYILKNFTRAVNEEKLPVWMRMIVSDTQSLAKVLEDTLNNKNKFLTDNIKKKLKEIKDVHEAESKSLFYKTYPGARRPNLRGMFTLGSEESSAYTLSDLHNLKESKKVPVHNIFNLVVATNNKNKFKVFEKIAEKFKVNIIPQYDLGIPEVEETGSTCEENAIKKAVTVSEETRGWVIADDSGLFLDKFPDTPGVYSSRFAGEKATDKENIDKLCKFIRENYKPGDGIPKATYKCTLAIAYNGKLERVFTGELHGSLIDFPLGNKGFSYDPLFIPDGFTEPIGCMEEEDVLEISHRAIALRRFFTWWKQLSFSNNEHE